MARACPVLDFPPRVVPKTCVDFLANAETAVVRV